MARTFPCSMQHLDNGNCRKIFQETCLQDKNVQSRVAYSGEKKEPYQLFMPGQYKIGPLCVSPVYWWCPRPRPGSSSRQCRVISVLREMWEN